MFQSALRLTNLVALCKAAISVVACSSSARKFTFSFVLLRQVALHEAGVSVLGGERAVKQMGLDAAPAAKHEYGSLALTLELVSSMDEAISHIHAHGSGHTEAIITGAHPSFRLIFSRVLLQPASLPDCEFMFCSSI